MAWAKNGTPVTLGSASTGMNISDTSSSIFNVVLTHGINVTSDCAPRMRFNTASGSVYSRRWSDNGGADGTAVSQTYQYWYAGSSIGNLFQIAYVVGIAGEEKLSIVHNVWGATAGAGTAPARTEVVSKWAETSSSITSFNVDSGGTYWDTDSNISALGSDLTPVAAIPFPSDVQEGSRAEITDTRKIYYYKHDKISTDGNYTVLKFTEDGTFTPTSAFDVEYLVIAGGGGGGATTGGGGGAGGFRTNVSGATSGGGGSAEATYGVTAQNYDITVGAGGAGAYSGVDGSAGSDSSIVPTSGTSIISIGGGRGGRGNIGGNGGSGGGAGDHGGGGGTATANQGYAGGNGIVGSPYVGGGGGGAGAVGQNASTGVAGNGGAGLSSSITGTSICYAGGGGAGGGVSGTFGTATCGGTAGVSGSNEAAVDASANTGGGGGGANAGTAGLAGGDGGSGIVIIRFLTSGNTYTTSLANTWQELGT